MQAFDAAHCIALTGVPRSGTTLACTLLNAGADVVALAEPLSPHTWPLPRADRLAWVLSEFVRMRMRCLEQGSAPTRQRQGRRVDNFFRDEQGRRIWDAEVAELPLGKPLSTDFVLAIKHNAAFLALLPELTRWLPVVAVVRNPLRVLASWNSIDLPVSQGYLPVAEQTDDALRAALAAHTDVHDRQLVAMDWCFAAIARARDTCAVVRYETMVADGGRDLSTRCGVPSSGAPVATPRQVHDPLQRHAANTIRMFARRLLDAPGAWRVFYSEADVLALLPEA
ncbi:MAG: sulfotransferase [Metallibacterium scheffleri]|jgi:hypothetical protein|uniref:sulfotransferase n=1 Tax=Metallibacterium scheffleri TaxID=993689 RepID=UPI0026EB0007|nr:sulfotransferase [Metallibacterium scheffleri]MCK9366950.1 sulfotransferase [Metallibacterium scheffleri]